MDPLHNPQYKKMCPIPQKCIFVKISWIFKFWYIVRFNKYFAIFFLHFIKKCLKHKINYFWLLKNHDYHNLIILSKQIYFLILQHICSKYDLCRNNDIHILINNVSLESKTWGFCVSLRSSYIYYIFFFCQNILTWYWMWKDFTVHQKCDREKIVQSKSI